MRCKNCDYRLWNLRSRQCPECNAPFVPSDFEFALNSVQFACPHCGQRYYGTGEEGHLSPIEFDCVGCGRHIHMDEMVLLPTAGVEEEQTAPAPMPWLNRARGGFFRSWWSTVWSAMVRPGRLIRSVPVKSSLLEAGWFAIVSQVPVVLLGLAPLFLLPFIIGAAAGGGGRSLAAGLGLGVGIGLVLTVVGTAAFVALWGAIAHGVLCIGARPLAGPRRTYQAVCYSAGAHIAAALPCVGFYVGWIWWLISAVVMVKEGQRVSGLRASVAVLLTPCLAILVIVGLYALLFLVVLPKSGVYTAMSRAQTFAGAQTVATAIRDYTHQHDGRTFEHAAELVAEGLVEPTDLLDAASETQVIDVPVGPALLEELPDLSESDLQYVLGEAIAGLPESVVAHRLGDFVFTCNGVSLETARPWLWLFVVWPDPDSNEPPELTRLIHLGRADGTVITVSASILEQELVEQNRLRTSAGLPPLPHPHEVTHDTPGVARQN